MGQEGKAGALLARIRVELAVSPCVSDAAKATYGELAKLVTPVLLASALKAAGNYPDAEAIVEKVLVDLWLGILMLLVGIFFLVWARLSPQKPPEPNLSGTDRPMMHH